MDDTERLAYLNTVEYVELDPVGSTVRYELMKLCTGSVILSIGHYEAIEGIYAFIYCTKRRSGQVLPMPDSLTHSQTLKDRTTQLLINCKSGVLVTQMLGPQHICPGLTS